MTEQLQGDCDQTRFLFEGMNKHENNYKIRNNSILNMGIFEWTEFIPKMEKWE